MSEETDQELIARSRAGDREAFAALYERYSASGLRFATTLTGDPARASDLVSDAFIKIMALLDDGRGPDSNFNSYLLTSIRNVMIDDLRRHRREELVEDVSTYHHGNDFIRDHAADQAEHTVINQAFASLPERWREVLWYTEVLDESLETVAARFGVKANAVGVLSWRAREGFRQAYLAEHLSIATDPACLKFAPQLPRYVRNELTATRTSDLEEHLAVCDFCPGAVADLAGINSNLGALLAPVALLGLVPQAHVSATLAQGASHGLLVKGAAVVAAVAAATTAVVVWRHQPVAERTTAAITSSRAPAPISPRPTLEPTRTPRQPPPRKPVAPLAPPPKSGWTPPPMPPLSLVGPEIVTVRTSQTVDARIMTVLSRASQSLRLTLRISNAGGFRLRTTGGAWHCRNLGSAPGTVAQVCGGDASRVFSFDVSVVNLSQPLNGRIGASDAHGSATRSFRVSPPATPTP